MGITDVPTVTIPTSFFIKEIIKWAVRSDADWELIVTQAI